MDVLVAGAAGNFPARAEKLSPNGFRTVIEIDLMGAFHASRAAFDQLKETRGTIIYVSAGMALTPHAFQAHVGAAKAGIDMMMRNLAIEWGRHGIRTNSIVPGSHRRHRGHEAAARSGQEAAFLDSIPLRRMGTVDDIGQAAAFLASPMASYISGCVLVCDGGQNLAGSALFNAGIEQMLRASER